MRISLVAGLDRLQEALNRLENVTVGKK